jgi:hypothetical protein
MSTGGFASKGNIPIGLAGTVLLGLLWVGIGEAMLGEELRDMLPGAIGQARVVLVVELVRASHYRRRRNWLAAADITLDIRQ